MAEVRPEGFAQHSGRIVGATAFAVNCVKSVIQREGRWPSDAFVTCVRANLEDSQWGLDAC